MTGEPARRRTTWLWALAATLAVGYGLAFVVAIATRLPFPYQIAWLESEMAQMVRQLSLGQSLYVEPSLDYSPILYAPLYFHLSYWLSQIVPGGQAADHGLLFVAMRLVSLLSTCGLVAALAVTLRRRGAGGLTTFLLTSLFIAAYGRFEYWYDSSRVDSLFAALMFGSLALLVEGRRLGSGLLAGVVGGLGILTKQLTAPVLLVVGVYLIVRRRGSEWRRVFLAGAAATLTCFVFLGATGDLTNPWFYYFIFGVAKNKPLAIHRLGLGVAFIVLVMPLLTTAALGHIVARIRHHLAGRAERARAIVISSWEGTFALVLAVLLPLRMQQGASINHFIPLLPVVIVAAYEAASRVQWRWIKPRTLVGAICALQLLALLYNPLTPIATDADEAEGAAMVSAIRALPGEVYFPTFQSYAVMAGKPWKIGYTAFCDLIQTDSSYWDRLQQAVASHRFGAIIPRFDTLARTDRLACDRFDPSPHYEPRGELSFSAPFFYWVHRYKIKSVYLPAVNVEKRSRN